MKLYKVIFLIVFSVVITTNGLSQQDTCAILTGSPLKTGFIWDFGDGFDTEYRPEVTHTYTIGGTFTVTLVVADGKENATFIEQIKIN